MLTFVESPKFSSWKELYDWNLKSFRTDATSALWVFRGQSNAEWQLKTSLEREFDAAKVPIGERGFLEEGLIRDFQRRLPAVAEQFRGPQEDNVLAWLALMQHHGAPTRLLDWTYSFFVALFFAVESTDRDAAVYAIECRWCNKQSRSRLPNRDDAEQKIANDPYFTKSATFQSLFARDPEIALVHRINPFVLNPRLSVQQGLFLCPGSVSTSFEENLFALQPGIADRSIETQIQKLIIPSEIQRDVLRELSYMNINRQSLFPGIDGLAQSMRQAIRRPESLIPNWRRKRQTKPFVGWASINDTKG